MQGQRLKASRSKLLAAGAGVMAVTASLALAGASAGAASASASKVQAAQGGVIKFAEGASAPPNYIFPVTSSTYQTQPNIDQFDNLMWPEIYSPDPNQPVNDYAQSMAQKPVWNAAHTALTIKLNHYMWSDGQPVTARDYVFYIEMAKAEGANYGNYSGPTQFPYNLASYTAVSPYELKLVLKSALNPNYFDYNGAGYLIAIPQHAWDKESASGAVGNYDLTPAGAKKVLSFLEAQAQDTNTYATNPLWKVVDGAWTLKSFGGASSPDVFVANPHFSGQKPHVSAFEEIPFTTSAAEFTSLKAGPSSLSYGAVPSEDIPAIPSVKSLGFTVTSAPTWGFNNIEVNFTSTQTGAMLRQLYVRQALQYVTDQAGMIKHYMFGYGVPSYGPVPVRPKGNVYVTAEEQKDPYPFSIAKAVSLLKAHHWAISPGGVDTCQKGGPSGCGVGIATGQQLAFNLVYASGTTELTEQVNLNVSDASQAGIKLNATSQPFNTIISETAICNPKQPNSTGCKWQLNEWGGWGDSTLPSGNGLFNTGGSFNYGSYSNPQMDKYINETPTAKSLAPIFEYENLAATQLPVIYEPVPDNLFATAKNLAGEGLTSEFAGGFSYIEPQYWYFTK